MAQSAHETIEKITKDGEENHPDVPKAEAWKRQATSDASTQLEARSKPEDKRAFAAGTFMGFYLVNVRARAELCDSFGVSITDFTTKFANAHSAEYAVANTSVIEQGTNIDQLYTSLKPELMKVVTQDTLDIGNMIHADSRGACAFIEEHSDNVVKEMMFSKSQPALYKALME